MKTIITLFFLFIVFNFHYSFGQTNVYHSFPDSNAIWNVDYGGYECNCCASYYYSFNGDTVINTTTYHKMHTSGIRYPDDPNTHTCSSTPLGSINSYAYALRADDGQKKVFIVPPDSTNEILLYDFNLQVGDSVSGWLKLTSSTVTASDTIKIVSIDSVFIKDGYRKQWKVTLNSLPGSSVNSIVEGIGNTGGPFEPLIVFESGGNLKCFMQNAKTIYPDTNYVCDLPTLVNEVSAPSGAISVFPNPADDKLTIHLSNLNGELISFTIIDVLGKIFLTKSSEVNRELALDINSLHEGIYFIQAVTEKERWIRKFIKE